MVNRRGLLVTTEKRLAHAVSLEERAADYGAGVRIPSGAPFKSNTYRKSPFEKTKLKRFFKRFFSWR
ncbi:hypothetical protein GCM10007858_28640 [Bradyrhizobium liaoningense]|nr:hypothetical protein GCM10007858_28640 [Bradyrhizobium liaoningense]